MSNLAEIIAMIAVFYSPALIAGVVVIMLGVRGRAAWSSPYCRKCDYDLRGRVPEETQACPECGADLSGKRALGFVRHGRRWSLVVLGIVLILLPFVNLAGLWAFSTMRSGGMNSPAQVANLSNAALVQHVQQNVDKPWGWRELADRIQQGKGITQADCDAAMHGLIAYMKQQNTGGASQPLHWQGEFFAEAIPRNLVSDAVLFDFIDAYHGTAVKIDPLNREDVGPQRMRFRANFGSTWEMSTHSGIPLEVLRYPVAVRIDGEPVAFKIHHAGQSAYDGDITINLPPGEHEMAIDIDAVLADSSQLTGLNTMRALPEDWPQQVRRRWTITGTRKFQVLTPEQKPVGLTTKPQLDPTRLIHVKEALVRTEAGKRMLYVEFEVDDTLLVPLAFDVVAQLGDGEPMPLRSFFYVSVGGGQHYSGMDQRIDVDALDPSIRTIDLTLTPNPELLRNDSLVTDVWGEPVTFEGLPLKRYDAE